MRRKRLGYRRWQPARRRGSGVELGQQLPCAGPLLWVFGQAPLDQRPELDGKATDVRRSENYPVQQCGAERGAERPLTGGGEGKHRAQAEHIAGRADPVASGLFGGHETRRAEYHASARQHARLRRLHEGHAAAKATGGYVVSVWKPARKHAGISAALIAACTPSRPRVGLLHLRPARRPPLDGAGLMARSASLATTRSANIGAAARVARGRRTGGHHARPGRGNRPAECGVAFQPGPVPCCVVGGDEHHHHHRLVRVDPG